VFTATKGKKHNFTLNNDILTLNLMLDEGVYAIELSSQDLDMPVNELAHSIVGMILARQLSAISSDTHETDTKNE